MKPAKWMMASAGALTVLNATALAQDPATCIAQFADQKAAEIELITSGMELYRSVDQEDWDEDQSAMVAEAFALLDSRERPVDAADLAILDMASLMLADPGNWDRADDRDCTPEDEGVSIFCALQYASIAVTGEYQHRRTVLQEVRFIIQDRSVGRDYGHRMMDYNNDPANTHADILSLFEEVRPILARRLYAQSQCEGG